MYYHVFHDSFTGDIEYSGIDLFPKISISENKSRDFGELKAAFKTGTSKGSDAPTHPTQSAMTGMCQQPALTHTAVTTKRKGEEERNKNELFELQIS